GRPVVTVAARLRYRSAPEPRALPGEFMACRPEAPRPRKVGSGSRDLATSVIWTARSVGQRAGERKSPVAKSLSPATFGAHSSPPARVETSGSGSFSDAATSRPRAPSGTTPSEP